jgi:hypothetical protein
MDSGIKFLNINYVSFMCSLGNAIDSIVCGNEKVNLRLLSIPFLMVTVNPARLGQRHVITRLYTWSDPYAPR